MVSGIRGRVTTENYSRQEMSSDAPSMFLWISKKFKFGMEEKLAA